MNSQRNFFLFPLFSPWKILRCITASIAIGIGAVSLGTAGGLKMERHESAGVVDLVPGAERGTITQPLLKGTIDSTGQEVLFVITDASDKDFADLLKDALSEPADDPVREARMEYAAKFSFANTLDRIVAPNSDDGFAEIKADLEDLASRLFAGTVQEVVRVGSNEPRNALGANLVSSEKVEIDTLIERVS